MGRVKPQRLISIVLIACLTMAGCSAEQKNMGLSIKEYNDTVAAYNKLVTSFTRFVRLVDKALLQHHELIDGLSVEFQSGRRKVMQNIAEMEGCQRRSKEMHPVNSKIEVLIDNIKEYISMMETGKIVTQEIHTAYYNEMLEISADIVSEFDRVYSRIISGD